MRWSGPAVATSGAGSDVTGVPGVRSGLDRGARRYLRHHPDDSVSEDELLLLLLLLLLRRRSGLRETSPGQLAERVGTRSRERAALVDRGGGRFGQVDALAERATHTEPDQLGGVTARPRSVLDHGLGDDNDDDDDDDDDELAFGACAWKCIPSGPASVFVLQ